MKNIHLIVLIVLISSLLLGCTKNKEATSIQPPPPVTQPPVAVNQPPVARAGADSTFTVTNCFMSISVRMDGTKSDDLENKITSISWRNIENSPDITISGGNTLSPEVMIRKRGIYSFELQIVDNGNLTSKDTVTITIIKTPPKEYELDISLNTTYTFQDNVQECFDSTCNYYDFTGILGNTMFAPLGLFGINISEYTDTASSIKYGSSYLVVGNDDSWIEGFTSVNLKKLIQQGGGAFTGNFNVTKGTATPCDPNIPNIYTNMTPLTVTGNLDTATKKVSIRIKGKTFF